MDSADVDTELVTRLATLLRVRAGKMDDEDSVASMPAALGTVFSSVTFSPGLAAWSAEVAYISGEADLAPVLRGDLVPGNKHPEAGGWVWETRAPHPAPARTGQAWNSRG